MSVRTFALWLALFSILSIACAEEKKALSEEDGKKAAQLIKDLGAESFEARNNAEKGLIALGAGVLPLAKDAAANSADMEVKTRAARVLKAIALEAETDPVELAKYARAEAEGKRYADAAKFYAKAKTLFQQAADKSADEAAKKELAEKSKKAAQREERAAAMAKTNEGGDNGNVRVMVGGGAGAGVVIHKVEVRSSTGAATDSDW